MIACGNGYIVIKNEKNEIYVCGGNSDGHLDDDNNRDKFEKVECDFGKIKKIACGELYMMIQNEKNEIYEIYVYGGNGCDQLGLGINHNGDKYKKVEHDFGKIKNIACGGYHTVIQNEKNEIYVCGVNINGQLGLGDYEPRYQFEKVEYDFGKIKNIACGFCHTVIQNEKNEIYVCGDNRSGQLGLGDKNDRNKFVKVEYDFGEIKNIVCEYCRIMIQNEKNEIYACGENWNGQLGLGDNCNRNKFEKVEYDFGKIKNIACGGNHIAIQNEKNEIYVCGRNYDGQLGLGNYQDRNKFERMKHDLGKIKNIACSGHHTVIQNEKNEIYVCGRNLGGQLGLGDNKDKNIFEKVNTDDIFEKIYNFELKLNTEEIVL